MSVIQNPAYIDRCGEQVFVPPFLATLTDFYAFAVKADHDQLNLNICDRFFNHPLGLAKRRFTAFQYVFFVFTNVDNARCKNSRYQDSGIFSYQEVAVWMLLADHQSKRIRWFLPYIFVDNAYAMHPGREIYGFPKTIGACGIPEGPIPPGLLWLDTVVVDKAGGKGKWARLLEVGRRQYSDDLSSIQQDEEGFFQKLLKELEVTGPEYLQKFDLELEFAKNAYKDLRKGELPLIFLKQFRDGTDPTQASSLVVQEAASEIGSFPRSRIYNTPYELAIHDVVSHPIRRDLGLSQGQLRCEVAFWMSFKFSLGCCKAIT
jgi:hypothetical protein